MLATKEKNFTHALIIPYLNIANIRAPVLYCTQSEENCDKARFDIREASNILYPLYESLKRTLFP